MQTDFKKLEGTITVIFSAHPVATMILLKWDISRKSVIHFGLARWVDSTGYKRIKSLFTSKELNMFRHANKKMMKD